MIIISFCLHKTHALPCFNDFLDTPLQQDGGTISSPHFLSIFKLDPRYAVGSRSAQSKMATGHLYQLFAPKALSALHCSSFQFQHVSKLKTIKFGSVSITSG